MRVFLLMCILGLVWGLLYAYTGLILAYHQTELLQQEIQVLTQLVITKLTQKP